MKKIIAEDKYGWPLEAEKQLVEAASPSLYTRVSKGLRDAEKFFREDLATVTEWSEEIRDKIALISEKAEEIAEPGKDFHAEDYFSQKLNGDEKALLNQLADNLIETGDLIEALDKLRKAMDRLLKEMP